MLLSLDLNPVGAHVLEALVQVVGEGFPSLTRPSPQKKCVLNRFSSKLSFAKFTVSERKRKLGNTEYQTCVIFSSLNDILGSLWLKQVLKGPFTGKQRIIGSVRLHQKISLVFF